MSNDCLNTLLSYLIPGNHNSRNKKFETIKDIEKHLETMPGDTGCYVCSCGYYYSIKPSGFPTKGFSFNCPNCKLPIGYGKRVKEGGAKNQGMVVREGHYRIFKDYKQKVQQMARWNNLDENFPNMTLKEYKKSIIKNLNESNKGINAVKKEIYLSNNKNIRKLSQIGFR